MHPQYTPPDIGSQDRAHRIARDIVRLVLDDIIAFYDESKRELPVGRMQCRVARVLRDELSAVEADTIRQFSPSD